VNEVQESPVKFPVSKNSWIRYMIPGGIALIAACLTAALFCSLRGGDVASAFDKTVFAGLFAITIVAGAISVDYHTPELVRSRRARPVLSLHIARSWLSCFIAISVIILLNDVVPVFLAPSGDRTTRTNAVEISGTLTVKTPTETRRIGVTGKSAQ